MMELPQNPGATGTGAFPGAAYVGLSRMFYPTPLPSHLEV